MLMTFIEKFKFPVKSRVSKQIYYMSVDADITLFGGDINATPIDNMHQPYGMLRFVIFYCIQYLFTTIRIYNIYNIKESAHEFY